MDLTIFELFIVFSLILYVISRLMASTWVSLSLGWLAGGLLIIIGFAVFGGEPITATAVVNATTTVTVPYDIGISEENLLLVFSMLGLVMIFSSSGDWI